MLRKVFLAFLLLGFVALSGFFFYKFNQKKPVERNYFAPIPSQSIWVMDIREPSVLLATLKGTNIIYDEFKQNGLFDEWIPLLEKTDSIFKSQINQEKPNAIPGRMQMAMVPGGMNNAEVLISFEADNWKTEALVEMAQVVLGQVQPQTLSYDGATMYEFKGRGFLCVYNGFVLYSKNKMVVEDAIRQLNSGVSLMDEPHFKRVAQTAGTSRKLNWYIHQQRWINYLATLTKEKYRSKNDIGAGFGDWMELDLWLKPNSLMFNGYAVGNQRGNEFLSVFKSQSPSNSRLAEVLPLNTAYYINYNLSSFDRFSADYETYLKNTNRLEGFVKRLQKIDQKEGVSVRKLFRKHVGSEMGLAVLEMSAEISDEKAGSITNKVLTYLRLVDEEAWMDAMVPLIKNGDGENLYASEYRGEKIYALSSNEMLAANMGEGFNGSSSNFMVVLEGFAIFGESQSILREVINAVKSHKTLSEDDHYQSFAENISSTAHLTIYSSVARSPYLYAAIADMRLSEEIVKQVELLRKFQGIVIQISPENDLYYFSLFVKYNPIYKKVTSSLWETSIDTNLIKGPELFLNHYNQSGEILVQDAGFKLHLISNTGRILWSKQLDGKVLSRFFRVDKFKNKKYQILCNTASQVYLIDRNGKDVSGFPISSKDKLFALSLMDYDQNKKYRILVPNALGDIKCYNMEGKPVKGWKYAKAKPIARELLYTSIKKKDYIVALDEEGKPIALNRRGEIRLKFSEKMPLSARSGFKIIQGKSMDDTYLVGMDSSGNILKLSFTNKMEIIQLETGQMDLSFSLADVNRDNIDDYIFQSPKEIDVYDQNSKPILHLESEHFISEQPRIYTTSLVTYIALAQQEKEQIMLYNHLGDIVEGSPFLGEGKPVISDINLDGRLELITATKSGNVYCYTLN